MRPFDKALHPLSLILRSAPIWAEPWRMISYRENTDLGTLVTTSATSTRFSMEFFSVDVPFFNLYTGTKKIVVD